MSNLKRGLCTNNHAIWLEKEMEMIRVIEFMSVRKIISTTSLLVSLNKPKTQKKKKEECLRWNLDFRWFSVHFLSFFCESLLAHCRIYWRISYHIVSFIQRYPTGCKVVSLYITQLIFFFNHRHQVIHPRVGAQPPSIRWSVNRLIENRIILTLEDHITMS